MTSRERVLQAIAHREPDHVPVDLGSTPSSGISAVANNRLVQYLGLDVQPTQVYDVVQQLAQPDEALLAWFGADVLDIGRAFNTSPAEWVPVTLPDQSPALYPAWFQPRKNATGGWTAHAADGTPIAAMPAGAMFFDQTCFPFIHGYPSDYKTLGEAMSKVLWAAFVHSPWDHAHEDGFWDQLRAHALHLRETTDKALMIVVGCNLFEWGTFLRRIDQFLMDLVTQPTQVETLLDALLERHLATLERVCCAVGDCADIIRFGDDLGMDSGPFMSPAVYRRLFKPRHAQLCAYVKRHSSMHTFLHSCGGIRPLLPDLIEAGFEIINPVQTSCKGMEPVRLKADFGKDLTFWGGGCDTRHILNHATPEAVKAHVRQNLETFAPGGGFVFNPVHNILPDVPPQNIVALRDAVWEYSNR
ncbi:MAG: uroporphyrinogen decarboxylase family protein [bacterium]|jgi:uroporphyrinogen decarboxylase|nr:uroporphyrinogen decarboxylase family protein [bacterium]